MAVPNQVTLGAPAGVTNVLNAQISPSAAASGILAGDFLVLHYAARAGTSVDSFTIDSRFTVAQETGLATPVAQGWAYRVATAGTENGVAYTVDYTSTGTLPRSAARIYQFRGTNATYEGGGHSSGTSTTATYTAIATATPSTNIDRLGVLLITYANGNSVGTIAGWSGSDEYRATSISILCLNAALIGTAGKSGGSLTITSSAWRTTSTALKSTAASNAPNRLIPVRQAVRRASFY